MVVEEETGGDETTCSGGGGGATIKTQKEVNTSEVEAAATGKGSSEEEDRKDLEGNVTLFSILSALENLSRKFDHIDSQLLTRLDRNRPLVDQKTIDDMVKASVEERMIVLGVGKIPEKNDKLSIVGEEQSFSLPSPQQKTQQKSVNSPTLAKTPELSKTLGLVFAPKKNFAKELDRDTGVKGTLAEEFGSGVATPAKAPELVFIYVSSAKATKDAKDAQDAKGKAYGRCCRVKRIVKEEYAADKKKVEQAEAALKKKKKKKVDARKKQAELKKQEAEAKNKKAEVKKQEVKAKKKEAELKKKKMTPPRANVIRVLVKDEEDRAETAKMTVTLNT
ncbi:hypothetical protein Bca52824_026544 [Brassica carinata]|uniref:Uncharacterized protein n=1 Tax=Brassica carinata TaxID=52824 RepID=A0A8X7V9Y5_BRACI|nr:hypothetical protein Bca52824_026544 [Brassica carinata]